MLRLKYIDGAQSPNGEASDWLESAGGVKLQSFPRDKPGYAVPEAALSQALDAWLTQRGERPEPVVVMVHGYMFDPTHSPDTSPDSPFESIYGLPPRVDYHLSWLPLVGECDQTGGTLAENAVAFSYKSIAGVRDVSAAGWVNPYQHAVFDLSPRAARALASILGSLSAKVPTLRILAHSLGTRTTSQAMRLVRARLSTSLDRVLLLDGAEFCVDAAASFANCQCDVFNIVNRTDAVLRLGGETMCHPVRTNGSLGACVIGYEGLGANDRWLDLQLDNQKLISWLAAGNAPDGISYSIDPRAREESHPFAGLDHWSCYTNDGNRALVRDLLLSDVMTVPQMKAHAAPSGTNAPAFGRFNDQPIPLTPASLLERRRLMAQATVASGDG